MIDQLKSYFIVGILMMASIVFSQNTKSNLPVVFKIGENEAEYNQMLSSHADLLMYVCDNSMDKAFNLWTDMLSKLEQHSIAQGFDIRGIKVWVNVFWTESGKIEHIVYYPKPNSKNTNYDEFTKILTDFATNYTLPIKYKSSFSHYGSATFPIHFNQVGRSEK